MRTPSFSLDNGYIQHSCTYQELTEQAEIELPIGRNFRSRKSGTVGTSIFYHLPIGELFPISLCLGPTPRLDIGLSYQTDRLDHIRLQPNAHVGFVGLLLTTLPTACNLSQIFPQGGAGLFKARGACFYIYLSTTSTFLVLC